MGKRLVMCVLSLLLFDLLTRNFAVWISTISIDCKNKTNNDHPLILIESMRRPYDEGPSVIP